MVQVSTRDGARQAFCAGLIMRDDHCVYAAPILRWTVGLGREALRASFLRQHLKAVVVP